MTNTSKQAQRELLAQHIAAFLNQGGTIKTLKSKPNPVMRQVS